MSSEASPQVTEVTVNYHGGGKVAIEDFGKKSVEYGASISRRYAIPEGWTEEQVAVFELERVLELQDQIDPILQAEHDAAMDAREF